MLGREPEPGGLQHHLGLLKGGASRDAIEAGIRASQERRNNDQQPDATFVNNAYRRLLGRDATPAELKDTSEFLRLGLSRDDVLKQLVASDEFKAAKDRPKLPPAGEPGAPAAPGAVPAGPFKPGVVRDGPGGFLWKPKSDSDGKLAVLLPPQISGGVRSCVLVGPDGKQLEAGKDGGVGNGDRQHYRFSRPGGQYPPGTSVVATLADGQTVTYTVQNTGARND